MSIQTEFISQQFNLAFLSVETAHEILFKDSNDFTNQTLAFASIQRAIGYISSIESICYAFPENLLTEEVETLLLKFNLLFDEFINCYQKKHAHQKTDEFFRELRKTFKYSIFS